MNDPILEEVRKNRRKLFESYDCDMETMMRAMMKKQWERGSKVVAPKRKTEQVNEPPKPYPEPPSS
jgi:hypothetical protein